MLTSKLPFGFQKSQPRDGKPPVAPSLAARKNLQLNTQIRKFDTYADPRLPKINGTFTEVNSPLGIRMKSLKPCQDNNKRSSILTPALELLVAENVRRASLNLQSRNHLMPNYNSCSTKDSSDVSTSNRSELKSSSDPMLKPKRKTRYRVTVTEVPKLAAPRQETVPKHPLRRMNLKLHPSSLTIMKLSSRALKRLEIEKNAGSQIKMDYLSVPRT